MGISEISCKLYSLKSVSLILPEVAGILTIADDRTYQAASLGTDFNWAFGVRENK